MSNTRTVASLFVMVLSGFVAGGCGSSGSSDNDNQAEEPIVQSASDYGVTDPTKAALVVGDFSAAFYVKYVYLRQLGTYHGCGFDPNTDTYLGTVSQDGQQVFAVDPGQFNLSVGIYPSDLSPGYIVTWPAVCDDINLVAGQATVVSLVGGTWSGTTGTTPHLTTP